METQLSSRIDWVVRILILAAICIVSLIATAQSAPVKDPQNSPRGNKKDSSTTALGVSHPNETHVLHHLVADQQAIWSSALRLRLRDAQWATPFVGITTGLLATDRTTSFEISRAFHTNMSDHFANGGLALFGAGMGATYLIGCHTGDDRERETGVLAAEAGLNSLAMAEVMKHMFLRQRPNQGDGKGQFFRSGGQSFYSMHSTLAWAFASVIAHEYPGSIATAAAFGGATAISMARVTGRQHFLSDVFVGGLVGYAIGSQVFDSRHDRRLDQDRVFGQFVSGNSERGTRTIDNTGSTYIPLDSWIYPAVERLAALGYVRTQFLGLRPWTRVAVVEMLNDAADHIDYDSAPDSFVVAVMNRLRAELADETNLEALPNQSIRLESVYGRGDFISGTPLNDSYHFGQTVVNDFGRPYSEGFNGIGGFTSRAEYGRFSFFARGEYQHTPPIAALPDSVRNFIAAIDNTTVLPPAAVPSSNRFRLLDTYVGVTFLGQQLSVGKQSLWWGPGESGAMMMSNNAEPFYMVRLSRVLPMQLPGILRWLGPIRYDNFFGKLQGHNFPPQPYMYGQKISLKPTPNLEVGFSRTAVFAGKGVTPLTFGSFLHSLFSVTSGNGLAGDLRRNPGARHASFDFSYRLPGLRRWVTLYSDSLVHDDVSPLSAPRRSAINPGFYLSHVPGVPKLDFRVEAVSTDPPTGASVKGDFLYWEVIYRDLYLNKSELLGSWLGREGKGGQAWLTYWLSPSNTIQFAYRRSKLAKDFIAQGETQNDFSVNTRIQIRRDLEVRTSLQYERWNAPLLARAAQSNVAASVQLTYWPKQLAKRSSSQ